MPALENPKLELYCQERAKLGATDMSAYVAAGYSVKKSAKPYDRITRILKNTKVSARIAEIHVEAARANDVTPERVIQQLGHLAFTDIGQVVEWGSTVVRSHIDEVSGEIKVVIAQENWIRLIDSSKIAAGAAATIEKISRSADGSIRGVKMRPPMPAIVALGKHLNIFAGTIDNSGLSKREALHNHRMELMRKNIYSAPRMTREEWEERQNRRLGKEAAERPAMAEVDPNSH